MPRFRGGTAEVDTPEDAATDASATDSDTEDVAGTEVQAEPEVVDLSAFWTAVDAIDKDNPNFDGVKSEYDKLSRKGKFQATRGVQTHIMQEVENDNYDKAKSLTKVKKYFASLAPTSTATPTDPTVELVNRIAALQLAGTQLLASNEALADRVTAVVTHPDEKVQGLVAKLVEIRAARKPREAGGKRHSVGNHIEQVFANVASGTFMDSKAIADATSEEYEGKSSSKVSVEAKLKSDKYKPVGMTVETVDGKLGVRKN